MADIVRNTENRVVLKNHVAIVLDLVMGQENAFILPVDLGLSVQNWSAPFKNQELNIKDHYQGPRISIRINDQTHQDWSLAKAGYFRW